MGGPFTTPSVAKGRHNASRVGGGAAVGGPKRTQANKMCRRVVVALTTWIDFDHCKLHGYHFYLW